MQGLSPEAGLILRVARSALRPSAADRERISSALRERLGDGVLVPHERCGAQCRRQGACDEGTGTSAEN